MTATTRFPEARAPRGMVATPHLLATQSGVAALRAGGNALDAAIAAAATIAVVYPHMNGLGGDNVWLIHDGRSQALRALCGIGRAARAATIDWYAARGITQALPARGGPAALTVPAAVAGWWQAHRYSRETMGSPLSWKALLADAELYAREGFTASDGQRTPPPREPDLFTDSATSPVPSRRCATAARRRSIAATSPGAWWPPPPRRAARWPSRTWPSTARTGWSRCASPTRRGRPRAFRRRRRGSRPSRCWASPSSSTWPRYRRWTTSTCSWRRPS